MVCFLVSFSSSISIFHYIELISWSTKSSNYPSSGPQNEAGLWRHYRMDQRVDLRVDHQITHRVEHQEEHLVNYWGWIQKQEGQRKLQAEPNRKDLIKDPDIYQENKQQPWLGRCSGPPSGPRASAPILHFSRCYVSCMWCAFWCAFKVQFP